MAQVTQESKVTHFYFEINISFIFTTTFYDVAIFVDGTNNYQLTKSSNLQTNFCFMPRATFPNYIFKLSKCNPLYLKIQQSIQKKVDRKKIRKRKIKEIKKLRKRKENEEANLKYIMDIK